MCESESVRVSIRETIRERKRERDRKRERKETYGLIMIISAIL